jgi:glycine hydroxymethyltransferase
MNVSEMEIIGRCIADKLKNPEDAAVHERVLKSVEELCNKFPLYSERLAGVR